MVKRKIIPAQKKYERLGEKWRNCLPIVQDDMEISLRQVKPGRKHVLKMSWLSDARSADGTWGVGCIVCAELKKDDEKGAKATNAEYHQAAFIVILPDNF